MLLCGVLSLRAAEEPDAEADGLLLLLRPEERPSPASREARASTASVLSLGGASWYTEERLRLAQ